MRAHVLNGLLLLVALSGAWAWAGPDHRAHLATSAGLVAMMAWHLKTADRTVQRRGGVLAFLAVIVVGALGFLAGDWAVLLHVSLALFLVGAAVMMHVRAWGRLGDVLDAVAIGFVAWLALHLLAWLA